jgi:hypothetical protein
MASANQRAFASGHFSRVSRVLKVAARLWLAAHKSSRLFLSIDQENCSAAIGGADVWASSRPD